MLRVMGMCFADNRQSMSADDYSGGSQYDRTLADYIKFESEMSVVSAVWKDCKRLIEAYNEQQVSTVCLQLRD